MEEETEDQEEVGGLRMLDQGDDSVADDDNENDVTIELNNGVVTNPVDEVK